MQSSSASQRVLRVCAPQPQVAGARPRHAAACPAAAATLAITTSHTHLPSAHNAAPAGPPKQSACVCQLAAVASGGRTATACGSVPGSVPAYKHVYRMASRDGGQQTSISTTTTASCQRLRLPPSGGGERRVHGDSVRKRARQRRRPVALGDGVGARQAAHAPLAERCLVGLRIGVCKQVHQALAVATQQALSSGWLATKPDQPRLV